MTTTATKTLIEFDDRTVRHFMIASIFWSMVAAVLMPLSSLISLAIVFIGQPKTRRSFPA